MTRAARVGVALAGFLLVVLGASGAWLWWNYRPDRDQWIRTVHAVAAIALLVVAVTSGRLPLGVDATFDDAVKFVLLRGREVAASTYRWWAVLHLVLSVLVLLALVMVWLRARDRVVNRRSLPPPPAGPPPGLEPEPVG